MKELEKILKNEKIKKALENGDIDIGCLDGEVFFLINYEENYELSEILEKNEVYNYAYSDNHIIDFDFSVKCESGEELPIIKHIDEIFINNKGDFYYFEKLNKNKELISDFLDLFVNQVNIAVPEWVPEEWLNNVGWEKIGDYANGYYDKQDIPGEITKNIKDDFLFKINYIHPFETGFSLWIKKH